VPLTLATAEPSPNESIARQQLEEIPNEAAVEPLVVHPVRASIERIVPITRLPLRRQSAAITWPQRLSGSDVDLGIEDRHALLRELASRTPAAELQATLDQAYREEGMGGRLLALRALLRGRYEARDTFVDALHAGTDDERSLSVDALAALGLHEELVPAFGDRVEAIAAKAALAYVATDRREDYRAVLERHVDRSRCDAILALLVGVLT
jgi:hypothetical protein